MSSVLETALAVYLNMPQLALALRPGQDSKSLEKSRPVTQVSPPRPPAAGRAGEPAAGERAARNRADRAARERAAAEPAAPTAAAPGAELPGRPPPKRPFENDLDEPQLALALRPDHDSKSLEKSSRVHHVPHPRPPCRRSSRRARRARRSSRQGARRRGARRPTGSRTGRRATGSADTQTPF